MSAIILQSCPKAYSRDLDKALTPADTIHNARQALTGLDLDILAATSRIDGGRLGIPVYLAICGADARAVVPTRKQMGKGSSPEQAEASALMELMERYAFFTFWRDQPEMVTASWREAREKFGDKLIPIQEIIASVADNITPEKAAALLSLVQWQFYPATHLLTGDIVWLPLDWFRMLGEFNGSSAGNTDAESLLQGVSELVERHVSAIVDTQKPELPTISLERLADPALADLVESFRKENIQLVLKDISLGMPMPTVAALAWDPATFPHSSEIVFTAGTATSPAKAAIRAITEVAQLAGDFCSNSCYEASGLPKFTSLEGCAWLLEGPMVPLDSLPNVATNDIAEELRTVLRALLPVQVYAARITNPDVGIPAHYCVAPGLQFRERDRNQSIGLFVGRKLAEEAAPEAAASGLEALGKICPDAHYLPFFQGLLALREGEFMTAVRLFEKAIPLQPDPEARALAEFYSGYAQGQADHWSSALHSLGNAVRLCPGSRDYVSLLGVAYYRTGHFLEAEMTFDAALKIDKGSAIDLANRGMARFRQLKYPAAREDLAAALEMDPGLDFAAKTLAELLRLMD